MKFRKKPVVIEAIQCVQSTKFEKIKEFCPIVHFAPELNKLIIPTLEGDLTADVGDWIIKGIKGEFYPCKSDIFEATYERME